MTVNPVFGISWPFQDYDSKNEVTGLEELEGLLAELTFQDGHQPSEITLTFKGWK